MPINYTEKGIAIIDDETTSWGDEGRNSLNALSVLFAAEDKANGVFDGMIASDGGGLQVDYTTGYGWVYGQYYSITAGNKTATAGTASDNLKRNYLYLNSSGVMTISTTAPTGQFAMLAVIDCDASQITAIYDYRRQPRQNKNIMFNPLPDVWAGGTSFSLDDTGDLASNWIFSKSDGDMEVDVTRETDGPDTADSGAVRGYCLQVECTVADVSLGAIDGANLQVTSLDFNVLEYILGRYLTISMWLKSDKTGIYTIGVRALNQKSYFTEVTISAAGVWEKKIVRITDIDALVAILTPPSSAGKVAVTIGLAGGSSLHQTAGVWSFASGAVTSNNVNFFDTVGNYLKVAQVKLEAGDDATRFDRGNYFDDLATAGASVKSFGVASIAGKPAGQGRVLPSGTSSEIFFDFGGDILSSYSTLSQNLRINDGFTTANATLSATEGTTTGSKLTYTHSSLTPGPAILETNGAGEGKVVFS